MAAIIDTLHLHSTEIPIIKSRYRDCNLSNQNKSECGIQTYRVIISEEDLSIEEYYLFLFRNGIATSSANFAARVESDARFVERMRVQAMEEE